MGKSVYVIGAGGGPYKVGVATNPAKRLKDMQTGSPAPLGIQHEIAGVDAYAVEALAHEMLTEHRLHGEWFDVSLDTVKTTLSHAVEAVESGITAELLRRSERPRRSPGMNLKQDLIDAAEAHCLAKQISKARLATIVINDGKFFNRIEDGGTFTVATYEKFMAYFAGSAVAAE